MIVSSIGLQLPFVVAVNPNKENGFFESKHRPAAKEERIYYSYTLCSGVKI